MRKKVAVSLLGLALLLSGCDMGLGDRFEENSQHEPVSSIDNTSNNQNSEPENEKIKEWVNTINSARAEVQDCGTNGIMMPVPALKYTDNPYRYRNSTIVINGFSWDPVSSVEKMLLDDDICVQIMDINTGMIVIKI